MRKSLWSFLFTCAVSSISLLAKAQDATSSIPFQPQIGRLPNGLTVVTIPWSSPGIMAYYTLVRVGSRDEVEPGHSGFAHLFEHMMFRGTERFPEDAYEETIQSMGADNNAYTTNDFTLYHVTAPAAALERVMDLESDRFQHLSYDESAFRTETGAVRGEYDKSASDPYLLMSEAISELAFTRHTYRHTTLGYRADILAMPEKYEYSRNFFRRFYTPDDCTIIVAGDVTQENVMAAARRFYGQWRGRRDNPRIPREPEPREGAQRHLEWQGESSPKMLMGWRTPAFDGGARNESQFRKALVESAALQIIHRLLFSDSSPLYQRLVVEEQRVLELSSWARDSLSRDPALFIVDATLKEGESFDVIRDNIQSAFDELATGNLPAERIAATQSNLRYALVASIETADDAADKFASMMALTGRADTLELYVDALSRVTAEDIRNVARKYLVASRRFVVTLAPRTQAGGEGVRQEGAGQ